MKHLPKKLAKRFGVSYKSLNRWTNYKNKFGVPKSDAQYYNLTNIKPPRAYTSYISYILIDFA